jgi:hypothetical protein
MNQISRVSFHFLGITVIVPQQANTKVEVVAIDLGIPNRNEIIRREKEDGLHATRFIANIVLFHKREDERYDLAIPIKNFDPPIKLRVGYNYFDILEVGGKNQNDLKLAYWDGAEWVLISEPDHKYMILPPNTGQVAEAEISQWIGDPPIAWVR